MNVIFRLMRVASFLVCALPLHASTRLIFPRVLLQQGVFTGIAIANPTAGSATITLKGYTAEGQVFSGSGVTNPRNETLSPGQQYVKLAKEIFNPPASIGDAKTPTRLWVEVTSPTDGLTGFFLDGDDNLNFMDGSDVGSAGMELILPMVENNAPSVMEIALVNPSDEAASVYFEFFRGTGTNRALVSAQLEPQTKAIFSYQALRPPFFTGLAILNPSSLTTNVEVVSLGSDGKPLGKSQRALRPGERQSQLVEQWVPSAAGASGGQS